MCIGCWFQSLCNACGIRFKKEERRAAATSTANGAASGVVIEPSHVFNHHNNPWNIHHQHSQAQKMPCLGNEFRFMDDENHEPADSTGISFLSWRLNVTDRPSLVHDFTRWSKKMNQRSRLIDWSVDRSFKKRSSVLLNFYFEKVKTYHDDDVRRWLYSSWSSQLLSQKKKILFLLLLASFFSFLHRWSKNGIILCSYN